MTYLWPAASHSRFLLFFDLFRYAANGGSRGRTGSTFGGMPGILEAARVVAETTRGKGAAMLARRRYLADRFHRISALFLAAALFGCGGSDTPKDAGGQKPAADAGKDAGPEAGTTVD